VLLATAPSAGPPCRKTGHSSKWCLPMGSSTYPQTRLLPGAQALLQRPRQMLLASSILARCAAFAFCDLI
jgi:hypothetical protein